MKLDREDLEYCPSNKIEGFREQIEHRCSEGYRGRFFKRVLECASNDILEGGLGFQQCNAG